MSLQACANLVHQADPDRWRAVMAAPPVSRERMLPVYAANVEISRAPWVTKEPFIALMRLQWWRDAMTELREGAPRTHEVVDALAQLPMSATSALDVAIDARQSDVDRDPFLSVDDLLQYAMDTTYGAMAGTYLSLGGDAVHLSKVMSLSTAVGTARLLCSYADLIASGWNFLPSGWTPQTTKNVAEQAMVSWEKGAELLALKSSCGAAFIEAAGADRFLHFIRQHPNYVEDGRVPSFVFRTSLSRTRCAWGIKPFAFSLAE